MDDETPKLVERACKGDGAAFAELVERHRKLAASTAFGILGEVHHAADAVQESFFKAFQRLDQLQDPERFLSWFLAIVRATAMDIVRRRVRWGTREVPYARGTQDEDGVREPLGRLPSGAAASTAPFEVVARAEEADRIREALMALPPDYREVLLLKHLEGRSYREIARLLKQSVRAVESKLFRARQQLTAQLRKRDVAEGIGVENRSQAPHLAGADAGADAGAETETRAGAGCAPQGGCEQELDDDGENT
ncbi:MAG: RNA polymerase sigma factor [Planctomycetes bacterium]|nr:RNA polymerase sigma factor [Planctomycetota bacterium]